MVIILLLIPGQCLSDIPHKQIYDYSVPLATIIILIN